MSFFFHYLLLLCFGITLCQLPGTSESASVPTLEEVILSNPQYRSEFVSLLESVVEQKVEKRLQSLVQENSELKAQFKELQDHVGVQAKEHNEATLRTRRTLSDITSISRVKAVRNYFTALNVDSGDYSNPDNFPTTSAQDWEFFKVSLNNKGTVSPLLGSPIVRDECLALASYERCKVTSCATKTKDNVAQIIFSWNAVEQAWLETGPGATGPRSGAGFLTKYRPIIANGVKKLVHFSPDGRNDFIIPVSFDEDVKTSALNPTNQCQSVWKYSSSGWAKYQSCAWKASGSQDIGAFKIGSDQFIVQTSMVSRTFDSSGNLTSEIYSGLPTFILKWSNRALDNTGKSYPNGFFLTGGETGVFNSSSPTYNTSIGNNGENVFQVIPGLTGIIDSEAFEINGVTYLAFASHISDQFCDANISSFPSCLTVESSSSIYYFDPTVTNMRSDCSSSSNLANCSVYDGEFVFLQSIPTVGARAIHYFSITTTGQQAHYLAIAEHRNNFLDSVQSSIWKWNGREFGLFQKLDTDYAESFDSIQVRTQTFLVVANSGCPQFDGSSFYDQSSYCSDSTRGTATIWYYDSFVDRFLVLEDTDSVGLLSPYSSAVTATNPDTIQAKGLALFQLPSFNFISLGDNITYFAVAHSLFNEKELIGPSCPSNDHNECYHIPSIFSIETTIRPGISTKVDSLNSQVQDTSVFLSSLEAKLNGGNESYQNIIRNYALDIKTFGAYSADSIEIDGDHYLVIGFHQAYISFDDCVTFYTDFWAPASQCRYLSPNSTQSSAVANMTHCERTCGTSSKSPDFLHHKTETKIYKLGTLTSSSTTTSTSTPKFYEIQRIQSLGVTSVKFLQFSEPATQDRYEACFSEYSGSAECYNEAKATHRVMLAISNGVSSCEYDYRNNTLNERDPDRAVKLYEWNSELSLFQLVSKNTDVCKVIDIEQFSVSCQKFTPSSLSENIAPPTCGVYLAMSEDCTDDSTRWSLDGTSSADISYRVSFHKWDPSSKSFRHCQPHPDPGHPINSNTSPCWQPSDSQRSKSGVDSGNFHSFDFPDLLPTHLLVGSDITDDGSMYYPQLRGKNEIPYLEGNNIGGIEFGVPRAQKSVYYVDDQGSDSKTVVPDVDNLVKSEYFINGRKQYELILSVVYHNRLIPPQTFGLEAIKAKDPECAVRHATTPKRREFTLVQNLVGVSGGKDSAAFERVSVAGAIKSYHVFPERYSRTATGGTQPQGFVSSLFVNEICNEYTQYSYSQSDVLYGGIYEPRAVGLPSNDTKFCPYSFDETHFEAWESFRNYYNPVSPCKGKYANYDDTNTINMLQYYYNSLPPSSLRFRNQSSPYEALTYPRDVKYPVTIPTHYYSLTDYEYLHRTRDEIYTKLQDLVSYQANSVSLFQLCGEGGQLWMIFGQDGWDIVYDSQGRLLPNQISPPQQKSLIYIWNDRFAVASNNMDCTAAAARDLLAHGDITSARLGCFEYRVLSVPINSGQTVDLEMLHVGDYLFMVHINYAEGRVPDVDPNACDEINIDDRSQTAGVSSRVYSLNLASHGGLQCRQHICCNSLSALEAKTSSSSSNNQSISIDLSSDSDFVTQLKSLFVSLDSTSQEIRGYKKFIGSVEFSGTVLGLNLTAPSSPVTTTSNLTIETISASLMNTFVSLKGNQTISGTKIFAAPRTTFNGSVEILKTLAVSEDSMFNADLTVSNLHTEGLIDNVDLFGLQHQFFEQHSFLNEELASLHSAVCANEAKIAQVSSRLEGPLACATTSGCQTCKSKEVFDPFVGKCRTVALSPCYAAQKPTGCYPKLGLTSPQRSALQLSFRKYLNINYPNTKIAEIFVPLFHNSFSFVITSELGRAQNLAPLINATSFYDSLYCSTTSKLLVEDGRILLSTSIRLFNISCLEFDGYEMDQVREALVMLLKAYDIDISNVFIGNVSCGSTILDIFVSVLTSQADQIQALLNDMSFWEAFREYLNTISPDFYLNYPMLFETSNGTTIYVGEGGSGFGPI